ncbi:ATP-binding protein [Dapis sp. BLCC M126]|uniref:ATP-binding protein n=1 Tax=Dapis sp. BLCC M126 TaxID=3400189 RepID=UPI003CF6D33A
MLPNNPKKFTEKAWEAISRTPDIAKASQNQEIETEHLMKALLEQNGLATSLFNKAGVSTTKVQEYTDIFIYHPPKVKNKPNNIYLQTVCKLRKTSILGFQRLISRLSKGDRGDRRRRGVRFLELIGLRYFSDSFLGRSLENLLDNAEKYRQEYKDKYISTKHLILAYLKDDRFGKNLYQELQLDEAKLKEIISQVRGNQKVTDKNPESKYEALEKYRRELAKYLEQLQKARLEYEAVEAVNRSTIGFLATTRSELRTPLNAIIGYSDLLSEDAEDFEYDDFLPNLERIKVFGMHCLRNINNIYDILTIVRMKADMKRGHNLQIYKVEVDKLVQDVVDTAKNLAEKKCNTFQLLLGENLGIMYADVSKVKEVLIKILDHAANFTENGVITLSVERANNQKLQNLHYQGAESLNNAQNYIVFRVSDTGIGMTEEQLKDIFEPLTTRCSYSSLSLGLAICQVLCEMMGTKIDVESKYGEGSTFTVGFPERVMNETLRSEVYYQEFQLDEAKLKETISQVKKLTDKNFEDKYETSEIYTQEELLTYIKKFQEAKIKAKAVTASIIAILGMNESRKDLNAIIREVEILEEKVFEAGDDDFTTDVKPDLEQIKRSVLHLLQMISDCSSFLQIETGQITLDLENIEVNKLVQDVVTTAKNLTAKNRNTFKLLLGENLGIIYADVSKVKEVLIRILDNAAKFTQEGVITLSVERGNNQKLQGHQNRNAEPFNNAQNYIVFRVSDTGIGVKKEDLKYMFRPYFGNNYYPTTRPYGVRLGLSICKNFCEMMGAKIKVESMYGEGSTFTVEFPQRVMI